MVGREEVSLMLNLINVACFFHEFIYIIVWVLDLDVSSSNKRIILYTVRAKTSLLHIVMYQTYLNSIYDVLSQGLI